MRVTRDDLLFGGKWLIAFFVGQWAKIPPTVLTLIIFMGLDILTGTISAYVQHRIASDASLRGLAKKTLVLLLIGATHLVEKSLGLEIELEGVVAVGYIANEFISIVENVGNAGVPIPPQLMEILKRFQKLKPSEEQPKEGN